MDFILNGYPRVSTGCASIFFYDISGLSPQTSTGYGSEAWAISDIASSSLQISYFGLDTSGTPVTNTIDLSGTLPSDPYDMNTVAEITPSDLGQDTTISDGIYDMLYRIDVVYDQNDFFFEWTGRVFFTCNIECKMKTLAAKIPEKGDCCDCYDEYLDLLMKAISVWYAFKNALCCGKENKAIELYNYLNNLLININCNC